MRWIFPRCFLLFTISVVVVACGESASKTTHWIEPCFPLIEINQEALASKSKGHKPSITELFTPHSYYQREMIVGEGYIKEILFKYHDKDCTSSDGVEKRKMRIQSARELTTFDGRDARLLYLSPDTPGNNSYDTEPEKYLLYGIIGDRLYLGVRANNEGAFNPNRGSDWRLLLEKPMYKKIEGRTL